MLRLLRTLLRVSLAVSVSILPFVGRVVAASVAAVGEDLKS